MAVIVRGVFPMAALRGAKQRFASIAESSQHHLRELGEIAERMRKDSGQFRLASYLATFFEETSLAFGGMADQQNFTYVSSGVADVLGYQPQELIGRPWIEFVHKEDRAQTMMVAKDMFTGGYHRPFTNRIITKEGGLRTILWVVEPQRDALLFVAIPLDLCPITDCEFRGRGEPRDQ